MEQPNQRGAWREPQDGIECRARLRSVNEPYYVYVLHKPDGTPFYVGKGVKERALQHVSEARNHPKRLTHKLNTIRSVERTGGEVLYSCAGVFAEEAEAHRMEIELVRRLGRYDLGLGPLTNQTDGGEGGSNPSAASRASRAETLAGDGAENEERRAANRFFKSLLEVGSVPIKQVGSLNFGCLTPHPSPRRPSARQAGALAASAIANRVMLEVGASIPRAMSLAGSDYMIENGVGRDILGSGIAELVAAPTPEREKFTLCAEGLAAIQRYIPRGILVSAGVLC